MNHVMQSSFYHGRPISAIPSGDLKHFANATIFRLTLSGWFLEDIQAVRKAYKN